MAGLTPSPDKSIFGTEAEVSDGKSSRDGDVSSSPLCPQCGSKKLYRDGLRYLANGSTVQRWLCRDCAHRFSEKPLQEKSELSLNIRGDSSTRRQICALLKEAKNLGETQEIKTCVGKENATELDVKGKLVQFAFYCQKEGMADSTTLEFGRALRRLSKVANLNDPETLKEALSKLNIDENTKATYCAVYTAFLRSLGKIWKPPKYTFRQKLPEFLPTEEEIDQLIAGTGKKVSTLLQLIKETGMRMGECLSLTWMSISFQTNIITLTTAEKRSLPRIFKVSTKLMTMLGNLPKQNDKVFGLMKKTSAINNLTYQRKKVAAKLANPRIAKIHYHLIRHWYGTNEYHKKPDMDHVRRLLGHKSILSTQIYVNMEQAIFKSSVDEYVVKVASTMEEIVKLMEVGFEVVTEFEGKKLLRKRK